MVSLLLVLLSSTVAVPEGGMPGKYCDEVAFELMEYNKEFNAFSMEEIEDIVGSCEGWEERYESQLADQEDK